MTDLEQQKVGFLTFWTAPGTWANSLRRLIILSLMTYLIFLAHLSFFQRWLVYSAWRCPRLSAAESELAQPTIDIVVRSEDGIELHGWLALAGTVTHLVVTEMKSQLNNDRPVVLFFPGNAGNRSMRARQMAVMCAMQTHVMLVDYRGYADNSGNPSEEDFARDARCSWNFLTGELGVPPHRIVIYGESLGGGVATRLASELCQEGIEPGGFIAQSTFNSLVAVAQFHFPMAPVSWLMVDRFRSVVEIPHVTCPILQIHGDRDSVVPLVFGKRLFDAAIPKSSSGVAKRQFIMPRTDHNDVYREVENRDSKLVDELVQFFERVASTPQPTLNPEIRVSQIRRLSFRSWLFQWIDGTIVVTITILLLFLLVWRGSRVKTNRP